MPNLLVLGDSASCGATSHHKRNARYSRRGRQLDWTALTTLGDRNQPGESVAATGGPGLASAERPVLASPCSRRPLHAGGAATVEVTKDHRMAKGMRLRFGREGGQRYDLGLLTLTGPYP